MRLFPVVLAAGKGTRMRSRRAKVLHPILGVPLLAYVLEAVRQASREEAVVVVGHEAEAVESLFRGRARFVRQEEQRGTADAVEVALTALPEDAGEDAAVLVVYGDVPLVRGEVLAELALSFSGAGADALLVAVEMPDPKGYGRVLLDAQGRLRSIVEEWDASEEERQIRLVNTGVCLVRLGPMRRLLPLVRADNARRERYLPDLFRLMVEDGHEVAVVQAGEPEDYLGVNDRQELARATDLMRRRILAFWMARGVTVEDPATTYVGPYVELAEDVVLRPSSHLLGRTRVGAGSVVGPMTRIVDSELGAEVEVVASFLEEAKVGDRVQVGPFAHLRPGSVVEEAVEIGNFAELKNVHVGQRTRIHHHCYLGDADVGADVNIGAGAITVNYDGVHKHRTHIGPGGFIGCNVNLIAPVAVGEGAYVAAGSTVDQDVPPLALAIARQRQRNILGWVERRRGKPREDDPK